MQRILLFFLSILPIYSEKFPGFISIAIVDTFTGNNERILLEPGNTTEDEQNRFIIKVKSINRDTETPEIGWIDLEIYFQESPKDTSICIQKGKISTNQIYRFKNERYIIGFDISPYLNEDVFLSNTS